MNWKQGTDCQLNNFDGIDTFHLVVHHLFDWLGTAKGDQGFQLPC